MVSSVVPDYEGTVRYLLDSFEHSKGFEGGRSLLCGAKEQAIGFCADDSRLRAFSVDGSAGILEALADGTAGSGLPGQEDGEQEETAVTEDYSFVVNEVQPVTPDPEAGMTEAVSPDAAQSAEAGTASETEKAADTAAEAAEAAAEEAGETASEAA